MRKVKVSNKKLHDMKNDIQTARDSLTLVTKLLGKIQTDYDDLMIDSEDDDGKKNT